MRYGYNFGGVKKMNKNKTIEKNDKKKSYRKSVQKKSIRNAPVKSIRHMTVKLTRRVPEKSVQHATVKSMVPDYRRHAQRKIENSND